MTTKEWKGKSNILGGSREGRIELDERMNRECFLNRGGAIVLLVRVVFCLYYNIMPMIDLRLQHNSS